MGRPGCRIVREEGNRSAELQPAGSSTPCWSGRGWEKCSSQAPGVRASQSRDASARGMRLAWPEVSGSSRSPRGPSSRQPSAPPPDRRSRECESAARPRIAKSGQRGGRTCGSGRCRIAAPRRARSPAPRARESRRPVAASRARWGRPYCTLHPVAAAPSITASRFTPRGRIGRAVSGPPPHQQPPHQQPPHQRRRGTTCFSARPGRAFVNLPSATTGVPFTNTQSIPTGY